MTRAQNAAREARSAAGSRRSTARTVFLIVAGTLLLTEFSARFALRWVKEPEQEVRFVFNEVWSHARNPFHMPDRGLFWRMIPGYSEGLISINGEGFRGPAFAREKPAGTYRVVVLGDSVAFGYGVGEHATYARQLELLLNQGQSGAPVGSRLRVEVINAGVTGYTSWQGLFMYERTIQHLAPDLVIVVFGYNDHHSTLLSDAGRYRRRYVVAATEALASTASFRLIVRVRDLVIGNELRREPVARVSVTEFEENLLALRARAEANGARCLFLTVPVRQGLPLVENFRAVDYDEDGRQMRVWMRQIDFAARLLGPLRGADVRRHFLDSRASLGAFARDADACAIVRSLSVKYPDFAIFWYLTTVCGSGGDQGATLARIEAADSERHEMKAYNARLLEMAQRFGFDVIDLALAFRAAGSSELFVDVVHPTLEGHALIARVLADHVGRQQRSAESRTRLWRNNNN